MLALVNEILVKKGLMLKTGTVVDATIPAPSSTKNNSGTRDPEMRQTQKSDNWCFGMKAHIGVDVESGLVHTVVGTAGNVHDITEAHALLHGQETDVYADSGYQGIEKRRETGAVRWHIVMRPGKRKKLNLSDRLDAIYDQIERLKTLYRGLMKNTGQITTLFALSNLWMARRALRKA
ncbi:IS5 family transposase [Paraburkholderia youngii]